MEQVSRATATSANWNVTVAALNSLSLTQSFAPGPFDRTFPAQVWSRVPRVLPTPPAGARLQRSRIGEVGQIVGQGMKLELGRALGRCEAYFALHESRGTKGLDGVQYPCVSLIKHLLGGPWLSPRFEVVRRPSTRLGRGGTSFRLFSFSKCTGRGDTVRRIRMPLRTLQPPRRREAHL